LIGALLLATPLILWVAVLLLTPTGWVNRRIVGALEKRTGRPVHLEKVCMHPLGGLRLTNLEIGSPEGGREPWLSCRSLIMNVSLPQILGCELAPSEILVAGARLRILRRADGSVELAEFTRPIRPEDSSSRGDEQSKRRLSVAVHVEDATIELIDDSTKTRMVLEHVSADGTGDAEQTSIQTLRGTLNGGPFQFTGNFDRTPPSSRFQARLIADDVNLDDGMTELLRYVVPVLIGSSMNVTGKLHADLQFCGAGTTRDALTRSLEGQGKISINPISLEGSTVVAELSKITDISRRGQIASVQSDFLIHDRRITTDHFTLNLGRVPITMAGWTDLDGQILYRINFDGLTRRIPDEARRIFDDLNVDLKGLSVLTLKGNTRQGALTLNAVGPDAKPGREIRLGRDDREKLKAVGRQFLDKLIR
jgi:AsmA protein